MGRRISFVVRIMGVIFLKEIRYAWNVQVLHRMSVYDLLCGRWSWLRCEQSPTI